MATHTCAPADPSDSIVAGGWPDPSMALADVETAAGTNFDGGARRFDHQRHLGTASGDRPPARRNFIPFADCFRRPLKVRSIRTYLATLK